MNNIINSFYHNFIAKTEKNFWVPFYGSSKNLAIASLIRNCDKPIAIIGENSAVINQLEQEISFFLQDKQHSSIIYPDWETLPYDHFSPHQDIISERLIALNQLPHLKKGVILTSITTLMHRLPPREYIEQNTFRLKCGDSVNLDEFRKRMSESGYRLVTTVMEHGEFAIRGSIIDIFPMGHPIPLRIDLLDQEVDSIRTFNPDTQLTLKKIVQISLLPAKEYPLTSSGITTFKYNWKENFEHFYDCPLYEAINNNTHANGIEYYLPLFFKRTDTLFDYLPQETLIILDANLHQYASQFWNEIKERHEQLRHDKLRPILDPKQIFLTVDETFGQLKKFSPIEIREDTIQSTHPYSKKIPDIALERTPHPLQKLKAFLTPNQNHQQILFVAETLGRKETLIELLKTIGICPTNCSTWQEFLHINEPICITVAPLAAGFWLEDSTENLIVITEYELFGTQPTARQRKTSIPDPENIIRNLIELHIGDPIVHIEHGIGRYLGLQTISTDECEAEFLTIEYANNARLYVPVTSLHLVRRFSGASAENIIYNHLGTKQWEKTKRQTVEKIKDTAAELLALYAKRATSNGFACKIPAEEYSKFASEFLFTETEDQLNAIQNVLTDMSSTKCMDRLICGDVGFGKTEIAMRAAFIAASNNKQVAILSPTTILTQQHYQTFQDRFANWPFKIEMLSRFRSAQEQKNILQQLKNGQIDIIIGTHKLLQPNIQFKNLGLLVIDEEHRFGVKQKEKIKTLSNNIDILTLTATPIPRTLNMAFVGIRDFSIIATPPAKRLAIKTFVHEHNKQLVREAILREILRGGQVYFLHNDITTIKKTAQELLELVPNLKLVIAHGQMYSRDLEHIMNDFYHQRYNLLLCTTIIESGIDIPTANTIIIDRADKFGLAQLHQLRGRVGRSTHQAYAYLLTLSPKHLTSDAKKRLNAIAEMEDLGAGFNLATHDLEIRGAGELLGEEQSGQIANIGFSLYMEYLERAIDALKNHREFSEESCLTQTEIDLHLPALIPSYYVEDVNVRLVLYKRLTNAKNNLEVQQLQEEIIDRFGILPEATKNLLRITVLKLQTEKSGIKKIIANNQKGTIEFVDKPNIDPQQIIKLIQKDPQTYRLKNNHQLEFLASTTATNRIEFIEKLIFFNLKEF